MAEPGTETAVDDRPTFEFFGEQIQLADDSEYEFALLEFAAAAEELDTESLAGAAALYRVLKAVVHSDDVPRFLRLARVNKAQAERDLLPIIVAAFQRETGRPTGQPAESSAGLLPTNEPSVGGSSSRVIALLESQGRPDKAQIVDLAQRSRASA